MTKGLIFVLILSVGFACKPAKQSVSVNQLSKYDEISQYYSELASKDLPVKFYRGESVQQIILIRHGEPILDKKSARSRKAMKQYIYDYDTAKVYPFSISPVVFETGEIDTIYSSPIVRASDTAHKIFSNKFTIIEDSRFVEFEREVFPLPFIPLRPKTWGILSRIPWILGLQSREIEGFRKAKKRAKNDGLFLEMKANEHGRAVLVAHGFLNRYLNKYLQEQGWQLSYDGGKGYLSVQVLTRITVE